MDEKNELIQKQTLPTVLVSLGVSILGSIALMPFENEPSIGFFIFFMSLLLGNLYILKRLHTVLRINSFSVMLILSYIFLTIGFISNTKEHFFNVFFLFVLLPILNVSLVSNILEKNFIYRYFYSGLIYMYSKI